MAPQFVTEMSKKLRRKSVVPFFPYSTNTIDASSNESNDGTTGSSGSVTPLSYPSSETALDELIRTAPGASTVAPTPYPRPLLRSSSSAAMNRHGTAGAPGQRSKTACFKYAPRITNIFDNNRVCQKVLLIRGIIGEDPSLVKIDGVLTVTRLDDGFPPTKWPVIESNFKSLIYLDPGPNRLRFEFSSPKLSSGGATPAHVSFLTVIMVPTANSPPLQLAIILAKDSPGRFDATPARAEREGDNLETAVSKFRMAAYLWQAFTADQMNTHKLGRRTFRYEEEWTTGTASSDDLENGSMRSEARIHIVEVDRTVEELRAMDRDLAQMREVDGDTIQSQLYTEVADAVRKRFRSSAGQKHYVAAMLLDSHWDAESKQVEGHVAAGGFFGDIGLALFGSHCLHSYPGSIQEVVPAFTDCTQIDDKVFNNGGEAGRSWEVANFGIGAHLRQIGRLFGGCQEQGKGIMADTSDHLLLSRTFVPREAFSTRTNSKGGLVRTKDQPRWHRLDCLLFSHHACFRLPGQQPVCADASIQAWPVEGGNLAATAPSGIALVEVFVGDERGCSTWEEYLSDSVVTATKQVTLSEMALRMKLPDSKKRGRLRVRVTSCGGGQLDIRDFREMASCEAASLKLETGKVAFRGKAVGGSSLQDVETDAPQQDLVWSSAVVSERILSDISVYHNGAISGIEFVFDDGSSQLLGAKGREGQTTQENFSLDVERGELVSSLFVRAGSSISALQVVTSLGRRSPIFGSRFGGKPQTLIPPRGFTICGVTGKASSTNTTAVLESLSVVITR